MRRCQVRSWCGVWAMMPLAVLPATMVGVIPVPASAQQRERITVARDDLHATAARGEEGNTFAKNVTVQLRDVRIKAAVDAIALSADVRISYEEALLNAVPKTVTLLADRMPLRSALDRILAGTRLTAISTIPNVVTIKIASAAERAQGSGTITGKITHAKTGQPLSGATVIVDDESRGVVTGEDGTFRITAASGDRAVTVRAVGFTKQMKRVTVPDQGQVMLSYALEPSTSVLNEVVVTGTVIATERKAIPTPITVIKAEDIEKRGITQIDQLFRGEVPGLLALETGTMRYSGFSGSSDILGSMQRSRVFSRGSASLDGRENPIKTYVDGVEILDPAYIGTIDPKSIERIEIITGPQAATIYGSGAMGGVMQIFTKTGRGHGRPDVTLNLKYGMLQNNFSSSLTPAHTHSLSVNGAAGTEFSYSGNLSYNYTGQWQPRMYNGMYAGSVGVTYNYGRFTASGSAAMTSGENGSSGGITGLCIMGGCFNTIIDRKLQETGEMRPSNAATIDVARRFKSSSQTTSLNLDYRPVSIWQHHLTVGKSQTTFDALPLAPSYWSGYDTLYRVSSNGGTRTSATYNTTLQPRFGVASTTLTLGVNGSWGDQNSLTGCLAKKNASAFISCSSWEPVSAGKTLSSKNWGGFGTWQLGVWDQLYLTFGLRAEHNPAYGGAHKVDWTPTNGITYTLEFGDLSVKVLGSYGRATRPPLPDQRDEVVYVSPNYDPGQFLTQYANPDLTPEYSHGPQGGVEVYYGNLGSITINHYRQTITDLIQSVTQDSVSVVNLGTGQTLSISQRQYQNAASIRQQGWEGTASLNLGPVALKGTYSWSDSRILSVNPSAPTAYQPGQAFQYLPTHTGNIVVSYARGPSSVTFVSNYVGASLQNGLYTSADSYADWMARHRQYSQRRSSTLPLMSAPGYVKSDLAVSQRFAPWISGTLNMTNIGNSFRSDASIIYPSLGRQTQFGVSLRYPTR